MGSCWTLNACFVIVLDNRIEVKRHELPEPTDASEKNIFCKTTLKDYVPNIVLLELTYMPLARVVPVMSKQESISTIAKTDAFFQRIPKRVS